MSKVELYEKIRVASRTEKLSIHALAARFKVHRRDVRAALASPIPAARKTPVRLFPVSGVVHGWIRQVLIDDKDAPKKQRHTAKRIHDLLAQDHDLVISESQCRAIVAKLRIEIAGDTAVASGPVFVPQTRLPGAEGEVDWGKFQAIIGGVTMTLSLFAMWLGFSTKSFHRAYANEAQESFTDAHMRAFEYFGGVPLRIRYDNLKTAAIKILRGRNRTENDRFVVLRSHYGFESFFCEPGINGAHEKGGVEGDIGRFRRNHLTPVPRFDTLEDLNVHIASCDVLDGRRWVNGNRTGTHTEGESVHGLWVFEQGALWPVPTETFDATTRITARADSKARICVRNCYYSVPARLAGQVVMVALGAEILTVSHRNTVITQHPRALHRKSETLNLDHYLEVLWKRPGGFPGSTALAQARATGRFRPEHQQFWDLARQKLGDRDGTRALCEILLLHRTHTTDQVMIGITAAIKIGNLDPGVVAVETRRSIEHQPTSSEPITIERPPDLTLYDALLTIERNPDDTKNPNNN
jgi:transposase